ncbi:MAG TPA: SDR family NAD(P)-dependent oxidoreductase [Flavitalea sp.]|nr:SDR family NAD(P)-dependent oxidoreductase [Flavitalea sp.]
MSGNWLLGKRIVIIGGTSGMGLSAAMACINEGAQVIVTGRNKETAASAERQLKNKGKAIVADATNEEAAKNAINICAEAYGGFDGIYHIAGGSGRKFGDGPLHELSLEGWQQTFNLNLTSLMLSNRAAINYFIANKQAGVILNMGSVLGFSPSPKYFTTHAYAAAKSAVIGFTRSIAAYYASQNIRVNVIAPALVETPMSQRAVNDAAISRFMKTKQPLDGGRIGIPEDTDGLAVFLLSDHAKFITGQVIAVDGGWSITEGQY